MSDAISPEDAAHVARLARLHFDEEELARVTEELNAILTHIEVLSGVEIPEIEGSIRGTAPSAPFRGGEAPDPLHGPVEGIAPEWREGFFLLPRLEAMEGKGGAPDRGE